MDCFVTLYRSDFFNRAICESIFSELGQDIQKRTFVSCFPWVRISRKIIDFFRKWSMTSSPYPVHVIFQGTYRYRVHTWENLITSSKQKLNNFPRYANSRKTRYKSPFLNILSQFRENRLTNCSVQKNLTLLLDITYL